MSSLRQHNLVYRTSSGQAPKLYRKIMSQTAKNKQQQQKVLTHTSTISLEHTVPN